MEQLGLNFGGVRYNPKNPKDIEKIILDELPKVYGLAMKLCKNPQDAEDLCQDTFVKAVRALPRFKGESSLSTWLYRIAVNTWKNKIRHDSRRQLKKHFSLSLRRKDDDEGEEKPLDLPGNDPNPHDVAEQSERKSQIMSALDQLNEDYKAIIILKDIEDRSYEEISDILDIHLGTVKSRLSRARDALRAQVLDNGGVEQ